MREKYWQLMAGEQAGRVGRRWQSKTAEEAKEMVWMARCSLIQWHEMGWMDGWWMVDGA